MKADFIICIFYVGKNFKYNPKIGMFYLDVNQLTIHNIILRIDSKYWIKLFLKKPITK